MSALLAKRRRVGADELSLAKHLQDTEEAACAIFREGTRWATSYLRFFRLAQNDHHRFLLNLRLAALFHDLGKANEGFQNAMRAPRFLQQPLRHEHLSAIALAHPHVHAWLCRAPDIDADVVLAAVLSHHLKAENGDGRWQVLRSRPGFPTRLFFDDPDVHDTLDRIAALIGPRPPIEFPDRFRHDGWNAAWTALEDRGHAFSHQLRADFGRRAMNLAVKAALIVADSVASGLVREGHCIRDWVDDTCHRPALAADAVDRDIIERRKRELSTEKPFVPKGFQEGAAKIGRRGLLLAACGAGKTLAAWMWASAVTRKEPVGRVIFLYPTRGTATEGFRDYVGHAPEGDARLLHGTARYELLEMERNELECPPALRDKHFVPDEAEARLFALGLWSKRYFSATVDQFLSFMEHGYGGMCLLPALADAAIIFDEVHSYDKRMWAALLRFLEVFDVPVLCMTATLPPLRKTEISQFLRPYPSEDERKTLEDLEAAESHLRYHIVEVSDELAASDALRPHLDAGPRILWVVNTVRRCQRLADSLRRRYPNVAVLVYHSRFKLAHRQIRHRQVVDAFRPGKAGHRTPVIAVTTQVCEMSLDLDADVLVTEHAPITSVVQRIGRANRHLRGDKDFRAQVLTYPPQSNLPYEDEELSACRRFVAELAGRDINQVHLTLGLERHSLTGRFSTKASPFLDGGFYAKPGSLRETDDASLPAILDCDVDEFLQLSRASKPTDGLRLAVPRGYTSEPAIPGVPSWLKVADGNRYDVWLGFVADEGLLELGRDV